MPRVFRRLPAFASKVASRVVYGPGYQRARRELFERVGHTCQFCGLRPAEQAHHYGLRYPSDDRVTADDLTALCRPCHWFATLIRLLDRTGVLAMWVVLATAKAPDGRRRASRRGPRSCGAPHRPSSAAPTLDLRALVERCHATLFVGCRRCDHFVRLDSVEHFRRRGWSGSAGDLPRLFCCRCRSRKHWIVLGGWPRSTGGDSARRAGRQASTTRL